MAAVRRAVVVAAAVAAGARPASALLPAQQSAQQPAFADGASVAAACSARAASISKADSRFTAVSYLPPTGLRERTRARSSSVIAPMRQRGGQISARSTGIGTALAISIDTSASPTPSSPMALATSTFGFCTKVSAAARTAFWSRGVKARRACWTRLPNWPSTSSGTSSGFCEQK